MWVIGLGVTDEFPHCELPSWGGQPLPASTALWCDLTGNPTHFMCPSSFSPSFLGLCFTSGLLRVA